MWLFLLPGFVQVSQDDGVNRVRIAFGHQQKQKVILFLKMNIPTFSLMAVTR